MSVRTLTEYPPPDWSSLWSRNWNAEEFIGIQGLTDLERDELVAYDGMIIYNKTTNEFQGFKNGNWEVFGGGTGGPQAFNGQYVNCVAGTGAAAGGNNCVASGDNSFAMGLNNNATAAYSIAIGANNVASDIGSSAIGVGCTASGLISFASGGGCVASGPYCHAEGRNTQASVDSSHAEGFNCAATNYYAHAEGNGCTASGMASHAEGQFSSAFGIASHAEGTGCSATGNYSHAEGAGCIASGIAAHAEGTGCQAIGNYSHAEGYGSIASGNYSHVEGVLNTAGGSYSHAGGSNCQALANGAFCHGWESIAGGLNSFSLGMNCNSAAQASYTSGRFTKANSQGVWIHGYYGSSATGTNDGTTGIGGNGGEFSFQLAGGSSAATNPGDGISVILRTALFGTPQPIGEIITDYFTVQGADYAEYFEWEDGNPNNEDRVGYFVELTVDGKIGIAKNSKHVIGIVSAAPSIVGDSASRFWDKTILRDDFGRPIITTLPDGRKTTTVNPNYDPTKQYIPRSERKEWAPIGLLGKLCVRDDGSCHPGCYCSCENGIAVHKQCKTSNVGNDCRWKVIKRISKNVVQILYTFK